ncbi:MAG: VTT domain-containing protein [Candidatus Jordarchaeales archaeon]
MVELLLPLFVDLEQVMQSLFFGVIFWILKYGFLGFYAAMIVQAIIAIIPSELILMFGGVAFTYIYWPVNLVMGFDYALLVATLVGGVGELTGAVAGFYIARVVGRPIVARLEEKAAEEGRGDPEAGVLGRFEKVVVRTLGDAMLIADNWIERWGAIAVLVARLAPPIPFDAVSYGSGLTKIRFKPYIAATAVGAFPRALMYTYIGKRSYESFVVVPQVLRGLLFFTDNPLVQFYIYSYLLGNPIMSNPYTLFFATAAAILALLYVSYKVIRRVYFERG